jgi:hypothetical protein
MKPTEALTPEERLEHARLLSDLKLVPELQPEMVAEVLLFRRLEGELRKSPYLRANPRIRELMNRMPGSRNVPRSKLPHRG